MNLPRNAGRVTPGRGRHESDCKRRRHGVTGEIARTYDQPGTGMIADSVLEATVDESLDTRRPSVDSERCDLLRSSRIGPAP
jgi:hypothetical protein